MVKLTRTLTHFVQFLHMIVFGSKLMEENCETFHFIAHVYFDGTSCTQ